MRDVASLDSFDACQERFAIGVAAIRTVVVVDDDKDMRELIEIKLAVSGFRVVTAVDGVEGFETCERTRPDFAVVDVNMPRMSGLEMVALMRRTPSLKSTPVLMLSALFRDSDKRAGLAAGADDYMTKPFSPAALLDRIVSMLDSPGRSAAHSAG